MKLTKQNDLITLSRQEVARAIGEYVQREHERLTGEAGLRLVMSVEDGELNGQPVPQLKVSASNRQTGYLRLDKVVVEVDRSAASKKAKDEADIVQNGKKTLAGLKADDQGRTAAFKEGVAAAEDGINDCPYRIETANHADWQHGHLVCRLYLARVLNRGGRHAM